MHVFSISNGIQLSKTIRPNTEMKKNKEKEKIINKIKEHKHNSSE